MFEGYVTIRNELPDISKRLKFATAHRDKNAHQRAYRDLFSLVNKELRRIPDKLPDMPLFTKPKADVQAAVARTIKGDAPIPLVNQAGTIFMGCPYCEKWVDITKVFTERAFNAIYQCEKGHKVFFGGLSGNAQA